MNFNNGRTSLNFSLFIMLALIPTISGVQPYCGVKNRFFRMSRNPLPICQGDHDFGDFQDTNYTGIFQRVARGRITEVDSLAEMI